MKIIFKDFRLLDENEHKKLIEIRNSDYVRFNMKNSNLISIHEHLEFIDSLKNTKDNKYYSIIINNEIRGAIYITNINLLEKNCYWGLYIKENSNPYISSFCTYLLLDKIFYTLGIKILNLEVKKSNILTYKFDLNFGFILCDDNYQKEDYHLMYMTKEMWENKKNSMPFVLLRKKIDKIEYKFEE